MSAAAKIAAKRWNYLGWCMALLNLWAMLSCLGILDTIDITGVLLVLAQ